MNLSPELILQILALVVPTIISWLIKGQLSKFESMIAELDKLKDSNARMEERLSFQSQVITRLEKEVEELRFTLLFRSQEKDKLALRRVNDK